MHSMIVLHFSTFYFVPASYNIIYLTLSVTPVCYMWFVFCCRSLWNQCKSGWHIKGCWRLCDQETQRVWVSETVATRQVCTLSDIEDSPTTHYTCGATPLSALDQLGPADTCPTSLSMRTTYLRIGLLVHCEGGMLWLLSGYGVPSL